MTTSERPAAYLALGERIQRLKDAGICYQCHDLATGEVFPDQSIVADEERIRIVLDTYPKGHGHTIIVWKPHRADFTELDPHETAELFTRCNDVANAIERGLGAEKIYMATMCDGEPNHLHIQLIPRYPGKPVGSRRLSGPRFPIRDADATIAAVRTALLGQ